MSEVLKKERQAEIMRKMRHGATSHLICLCFCHPAKPPLDSTNTPHIMPRVTVEPIFI